MNNKELVELLLTAAEICDEALETGIGDDLRDEAAELETKLAELETKLAATEEDAARYLKALTSCMSSAKR